MMRKIFILIALSFSFSNAQITAPTTAASASSPANCPYFIDSVSGRLYGTGSYYAQPAAEVLAVRALPYYKRLSAALSSRGIILIAVPIPNDYEYYMSKWPANDPRRKNLFTANPDGLRSSYLRFLSALEQNGIASVNVYEVADALETNNGPLFFMKEDRHWSSKGIQATANALDALMDGRYNSIYSSLPKATLNIVNDAVSLKKGGVSDAYKSVCGIDTGYLESIQLTKAIPTANTDSALTDDPPMPIVLLGTSQSRLFGAPAFANEIIRATNFDVLDYSIVAGGPFSSMISYFISSDYQKEKPKFIIWESEANKSTPSDPIDFRQVIPSIAGECTNKAAIAQNSIKLTGNNEATLFKLTPDSNISGHSYYIYLQTKDLTLVNLAMKLSYKDESSEIIEIRRSPRVTNNGRFFIELSDAFRENLTKVSITSMDGSLSNLDAKICNSDLK